jgi:hypothetical protein
MIWILNWLEPETVLMLNTGLIAVSAVVLLSASFIRYFPVINIYRVPIQLAAVALLVFGIYYRGALSIELEWKQRVAELEKAVAAAESRSREINTRIVTRTVTRVKNHVEYRDRVRKEIEIKREIINADCSLNPAAVEAYNKAVNGAPNEK